MSLTSKVPLMAPGSTRPESIHCTPIVPSGFVMTWRRFAKSSPRDAEPATRNDVAVPRTAALFPKSDIVSLGERWSPLLECPRLARAMQMDQLWIKDESMLPTGSFKSRGLAMAITMAKSLGIRRVALPTAGNAGGAAAAYAARAGIECFVFMPEDTPVINQYECALYGARTFLVNGLINDCGRIVREGKDRLGWFDLSTLKEPYRIEGKKTMGLELAEQFEWDLPDVILYPTGGGTGLIGMWKAFAELEQLGWLKSHRKPRNDLVQSTGCAPDRHRVRKWRAVRGSLPERPDAGQRTAGARGCRGLHDSGCGA